MKLTPLLLGASMLSVAGVVQAQTTDEADPESDDRLQVEIMTVTAQKREEGVQEIGLAVTAFGERAVDDLNTRGIDDLNALIPNLTISQINIGPGLAQISIRGVNSQDPEKSFDPAVGVFLDGVYLGTSAFNVLDAFDLERLEVLRGPQGTLFGRNTTGGAINAFRTKPTGEFGVKASVILGNKGRNDYKAVVNAPIVQDVLALKVSGFYQNDDGLWDNPTPGGPTGAVDRWAGSARLLFTPHEDLEIDLIYDRAEDSSELTPYVPAGVAAPSPLPILITDTTLPTTPVSVVPAFSLDLLCILPGGRCRQTDFSFTRSNGPHLLDATLDAVTLNISYDISDTLELAAVAGWRRSEESVLIDFDGTDLTVFDVVRNQDYEQYSAEIRVASSFEGPLNFVAGLFYFHSEYELQQAIKLDLADVGVPVPLGALFINGNGDEDQHEADTYAIFAQADYDLTETLTLTFGARASWDRKEVFTQFFGSNLPPTAPYSVRQGIPANRPLESEGGADESWFQFTPKVALNWQVSEDVLLYASYTRGYNAGGFSARAGTVPDVITPFDPEFINAYEIGAKSVLLDGRLVLNGAFFYNDYTDKQEESIQPAPPPTFTSTTVRNVASARIAGFELEATAVVTENWSVQGAFGYLDAEYIEHPGFLSSGEFISDPAQPAGTLVAADFSTLDLRRTPNITAAITPTYTREIGPGILTVTTTARYIAEQQTQFFNPERGLLPDQVFVDLSASFEFGGPEMDRYLIKVFAENVTDVNDGGGFVNSIVDFQAVARPRQWGADLQVRF